MLTAGICKPSGRGLVCVYMEPLRCNGPKCTGGNELAWEGDGRKLLHGQAQHVVNGGNCSFFTRAPGVERTKNNILIVVSGSIAPQRPI